MIYLDTSVALGQLLAEDRCPPGEFWKREIVTSRLLEYEIWNAIHRRGLTKTHAEPVRRMIGSFAMAELSREILFRANEPFRTPVRTLDALHLATVLFLMGKGLDIELASYDARMLMAAKALGIAIAEC